MTKPQLIKRIMDRMPYPEQIVDMDDATLPGAVRFHWRGVRYRVTTGLVVHSYTEGAALVCSDNTTIVMEALLGRWIVDGVAKKPEDPSCMLKIAQLIDEATGKVAGMSTLELAGEKLSIEMRYLIHDVLSCLGRMHTVIDVAEHPNPAPQEFDPLFIAQNATLRVIQMGRLVGEANTRFAELHTELLDVDSRLGECSLAPSIIMAGKFIGCLSRMQRIVDGAEKAAEESVRSGSGDKGIFLCLKCQTIVPFKKIDRGHTHPPKGIWCPTCGTRLQWIPAEPVPEVTGADLQPDPDYVQCPRCRSIDLAVVNATVNSDRGGRVEFQCRGCRRQFECVWDGDEQPSDRPVAAADVAEAAPHDTDTDTIPLTKDNIAPGLEIMRPTHMSQGTYVLEFGGDRHSDDTYDGTFFVRHKVDGREDEIVTISGYLDDGKSVVVDGWVIVSPAPVTGADLVDTVDKAKAAAERLKNQ